MFLTSCATVLHKKNYPINIQSNESEAKIKVNDSIYSLPISTIVERSNKDLTLILLTETKNIEFKAKPKLTSTFKYWNLIGSFPGALYFYAIDLTNKKRYYYGKSILLNTKDTPVTILNPKKDPLKGSYTKTYTTKKFTELYPKNKGEFNLHVSIPYVNSFHLKPIDEGVKSNTGFLGITAGLDYYYRKNQFLSLTFCGAIDFIAPFPAPYSWEGEYESMSTTYIGLSNNHKIKRFSIGYGLVYAKNTWNLAIDTWPDSPPPTREPAHKSYNTLGLVLPIYFQVGKSFNIGVIYRPTFYRFTLTDQFQYEHLISLDLAWKIRL